MLKHYVEFLYPGIIVCETSIEEVKQRNHEEIKVPKGSFGFRFFDREEIKKGKEILRGKEKNHSGMYYIGQKYNLNQIKKLFPTEEILIRNMERNSYEYVVKTRYGNCMPFEKRDKIIGGK